MIIPEYMRFYSQTPSQVLTEFAVTFFSLANDMYRIQAKETLNSILAVSSGMNGKESASVIEELKRQSKGTRGIVEEVKILKQARGES